VLFRAEFNGQLTASHAAVWERAVRPTSNSNCPDTSTMRRQRSTIPYTGVAQGSALSWLLFLIFMNALLGLITDRGQKLHISHGLKC
jgi:hypothetical protein